MGHAVLLWAGFQDREQDDPRGSFYFCAFNGCISVWTEEIHTGTTTRVLGIYPDTSLAVCFSVPRTSLNLRVPGPGCVRGAVPGAWGEELMRGQRPAHPARGAWHSHLAVARELLASTPPVWIWVTLLRAKGQHGQMSCFGTQHGWSF